MNAAASSFSIHATTSTNHNVTKRRTSIFVEHLDEDVNETELKEHLGDLEDEYKQTATISTHPRPTSTTTTMQLSSIRFSVIVFLLLALLTLSSHADLDTQLQKRQTIAQKRQSSSAPSFRIGTPMHNPEKHYATTGGFASAVVVGLGVLLAGLMS